MKELTLCRMRLLFCTRYWSRSLRSLWMASEVRGYSCNLYSVLYMLHPLHHSYTFTIIVDPCINMYCVQHTYIDINEWEHKVNECIRRIQLIREKHINRCKQHVLKSRKHLNYLHELQSKYVLVPADKAANNIIVVCKKYYLEVVLKELRMTSTCTYKHVDRECMNVHVHVHVVTEHLKFITKYKIYVDHDLRYLPSFYWLPKLHKQPYGTRFIAASNERH